MNVRGRPPRDSDIEALWPSTQSLDMVTGDMGVVADAVYREIAHYTSAVDRDPPRMRMFEFAGLREALSAVNESSNVPTTILLLPTLSDRVVLWNNSFLCDGWDALCANLTRRHGLETLHWSSHDEATTFQPGTTFVHRRPTGDGTVSRSVSVSVNDGRWSFFQSGAALAVEDISNYDRRKIKDRLNETQLMAMFARMALRPWAADFYDIGRDAVRIDRVGIPAGVQLRRPAHMRDPGS